MIMPTSQELPILKPLQGDAPVWAHAMHLSLIQLSETMRRMNFNLGLLVENHQETGKEIGLIRQKLDRLTGEVIT
jgi:hypothetical protein